MAKRIKGITIELDGETKGLDKALKGVNKRSRDLQSELKDVDKLLKFNPGNSDLIAQKQKLLADQVENTSEKLDQLQKAKKDVDKQFKEGKIDAQQYNAFQREIVETESKLDHFEQKLHESTSKLHKFGKAAKETGSKMKGIGQGMKDVGGTMTASMTAPIVGGMFAVTESTEEFRETLARLETNAENAQLSTGKMKEQLTELSGVNEDANANVEALSNLMASGFDEQGMTQAVEALSGAVVKFPDTMKIEGMADGLQETLATGEAIGPFAELLERMGMDLDEFNKGLEKAEENGNAQNYVLQTLAKTGLAEVNEKYRENNEELVEARKSQAKFQQSMGKLADVLQPIVTKITDKVRELIDWFNNLSPEGKKVVGIVAAIAAAMGPLIAVIGVVISAVGGLISIAGALGVGLAPLIGIIAGVVAAIGVLVAGFVLAYNKLDWFKEMVDEVWAFIKESFQNALDFITALFKGDFEGMREAAENQMNLIQSFLKKIWKGIQDVFYASLKWISDKLGLDFKEMKNVVDKYFNMALGIIKDVWGFIENSFKNSLKFVKSLLTGDFKGMKDAVSDQMDNIWSTIESIWGKVMDFFRDIDLRSIGQDIMQGMVNGIKDKAADIANAAKNAASGAINGAKDMLGIHSPSRVFREIGEYSGKGLELGMKSMGNRVKRAGEQMAQSSIPTTPNVQSNGSGQNVGNAGITQHITVNSPQPISPSETARKMKQAQRQLALEW